ncbi:putative uncharacterized protein encoded by MAPKAPK5-AS1 [Gracilinanus agilis]|uniref:putative uncharacterized protein encoded by MAPKAPK5-AS1 n=1 Tax=Gracilinanus agilis TaxID=191870 RepID=UPI001CFE4CEB|nr:putative uncharacterized protein encoded by MAPKAPK5-AS1 [Gracilinanus agilis]
MGEGAQILKKSLGPGWTTSRFRIPGRSRGERWEQTRVPRGRGQKPRDGRGKLRPRNGPMGCLGGGASRPPTEGSGPGSPGGSGLAGPPHGAARASPSLWRAWRWRGRDREASPVGASEAPSRPPTGARLRNPACAGSDYHNDSGREEDPANDRSCH